MNPPASFDQRTVDELTIGDERSFRHVALYADLKEILRRALDLGKRHEQLVEL